MQTAKRGRPRKTAPTPSSGARSGSAAASSETPVKRGRDRLQREAPSVPEAKLAPTPDSPTPKRGRPRKQILAEEEPTIETSFPPRRKMGRPPKNPDGVRPPQRPSVDTAAAQESSIIDTSSPRSETKRHGLSDTSARSRKTKRAVSDDDELGSPLIDDKPPKRVRRSTKALIEMQNNATEKTTPTRTSKIRDQTTPSQRIRTPQKQTKATSNSLPSKKRTATSISVTPQKRRRGDEGIESDTPKSALQTETPVKANFQTPSNKARTLHFAPLSISPLPSRVFKTPVASSPLTPHASARSRLHVAAAPEALPCREREFAEIQTALESAIIEETGGCVYVSGTPGTGKTATVRSVVRFLKHHFAFRFVEINGMKIAQPTQAYALLWEAISEQRVAAAHALRFLDDEFQNNKLITQPVVVLMDELDQLVTKSQDVMYNFFNWPSLPNSKLIVVAVANIMDLPERTLSNKISSRLGLTRIQFAGYTHTQLQTIIQARLKDIPGNVVVPEAIEFASRKVASVTGDARRALDICRRAVEIAEQDVAPPTPTDKVATRSEKMSGRFAQKVTIHHIRRAINESTSSPVFQFLPSLPLICKLILAALIQRSRISGVAENTLDSVLDIINIKLRKFGGLATTEQILFGPALAIDSTEQSARFRNRDPDELVAGKSYTISNGSVTRARGFLRGVAELVESGILFQQNGRGERNRKIRLNVSEVDIKVALKDDREVGKLFED
ncbi:P-loop containing nucleoside triphosphate hydrolase protein [Lipomyces kononenkoae]|uniref:P-loop containing nucleoside triphosphate hydrolase protein n=1 Tax=Lipomyces kononenkoae TaxID=34357 RepID=A0ACC3T594_LIPKO